MSRVPAHGWGQLAATSCCPVPPVPLGPMRLIAVFALIALAEMATFLWVGSKIGYLWAFGIAFVTAVIGGYLVKRAGFSVFRRIQQKARQGQLPGRELTDGACILVSGAFLISPGFITDTLGFLLLIPAVRALIHRIVSRRFSARLPSIASIRTMRQDAYGSDEIIDVESWE